MKNQFPFIPRPSIAVASFTLLLMQSGLSEEKGKETSAYQAPPKIIREGEPP